MIYANYPNYIGLKEMSIAGINICWVDEGVYLGMELIAGNHFKTDIGERKRKFFVDSK